MCYNFYIHVCWMTDTCMLNDRYMYAEWQCFSSAFLYMLIHYLLISYVRFIYDILNSACSHGNYVFQELLVFDRMILPFPLLFSELLTMISPNNLCTKAQSFTRIVQDTKQLSGVVVCVAIGVFSRSRLGKAFPDIFFRKRKVRARLLDSHAPARPARRTMFHTPDSKFKIVFEFF